MVRANARGESHDHLCDEEGPWSLGLPCAAFTPLGSGRHVREIVIEDALRVPHFCAPFAQKWDSTTATPLRSPIDSPRHREPLLFCHLERSEGPALDLLRGREGHGRPNLSANCFGPRGPWQYLDQHPHSVLVVNRRHTLSGLRKNFELKCALRNEKFCRYHLVCGPSQIDISNSTDLNPVHFDLPLLDDATSIQGAITQVCERLLQKRIETKRAGILLYAMQVAASNLNRLHDDRMQQQNEKNGLQSDLKVPPPVLGAATPPSLPDKLPPGTIQACQPRPRRRSRA
jgi:hypothetical protein